MVFANFYELDTLSHIKSGMPSIGSLSLSPSQRAALDQLRAITSTNPTGQSDGESDMDERTHNEIAVLESVQWDVEVCVAL